MSKLLSPQLLVTLSAVAALVACDSNSDPAKTAARPAEPPPKVEPAKTEPAQPEPAKTEPAEPAKAEPEAAAPAKVEAPTAGAPGPAYFAVDKKGVVKLDGGAFKLLEGGPASLQKDMQLGPDGAVWMIGFEDIYRLAGDRFRSVARAGFDEIGGSPDHLAIGPKGEQDLYITSFKGVSHWDGKAWTTEEKSALGAGDDLLEAIAVDRDGKVWVASSNKVHLRENGAWREVDVKKAKGGQLWFKDLELGPDGAVYVVVDEVVIKIGPTPSDVSKVNVGVRGFAQMSHINFSTNGGIGVISYQDVFHAPAGGAPRRWNSERGKDFKADQISAVAPDDSGRLWVGSEIGVAILGPGDAKVEWMSGSVPELVGTIRDIVVLGAGPAELPSGGPQAKGGLTGKILRDGAPVADTTIELCASPSSFFTKTPCADSAVKFSTKTDAAGVWTVADVPLGTYGLAIKNGKKWSITLMSDMGDGMKAGVVYDTGSISLDKN